MIEAWRRHFNAIRPHSSLGYRPPAPETTILPGGAAGPWATAPAPSESRLIGDAGVGESLASLSRL
jgi:hypothetical protein